MIDEIQKLAIEKMDEFLKEMPLMQISTYNNSEIWIATVWYASDKKRNLYFLSKDWRVHSKHIEQNPNIACAISGQYTQGPGEKIQGIQLQGKSEVITMKDMLSAYRTYQSKWPQLLKIGALEAFKGNTAGIHMYKVVPSKIVWFDEINFPDEPRIEIKL